MNKRTRVNQSRTEKSNPKRKRGRPEKPLKIDDTPRNIARSLFGLGPHEFDSQEPKPQQ